MKKILSMVMICLLLASMLFATGCTKYPINQDVSGEDILDLKKFNSLSEIEDAFQDLKKRNEPNMLEQVGRFVDTAVNVKSLSANAESGTSMDSAPSTGGSLDYSETNIQVQGVDEADIVKTDGKYIYTLSGNTLNIVEAYPAEEAELLSSLEFDNFYANEFFINEDRLIIFGSANLRSEPIIVDGDKRISDSEYYRNTNFLEARIYDISDKENLELVKTVDVEGNYISSRMIGDYVYYAVSTYPYGDHFIPVIREAVEGINDDSDIKLTKIAEPNEIGYFQPILAESFISIIALPVDENQEINKEVIVGSASNMYVSLDNMFIVQSRYGWYGSKNNEQETNIYKLELNDGEINYKSSGVVPGTILNQFSMDQYEENFRIATTVHGYSNNVDTSYNNMYVLDEGFDIIGEVEDIAPGESIYSVKFMGKRAYMVTFKHVDPLFVIDLEDSENPEILGKLKIPGYSDYLHPYDETHLIGIGKEVDASIDADKIHTEGAVYYTAIQGVKLAIFDVSDVSNPIEVYKEVIGDRGTESPASHDHKAFLFDKARELLIISIIVAELQEGQSKSSQGEFTFQGAYVYNLNLEDGFDLRGKVSHIEDDSTYAKSGYRLGDYNDHVRRSLYIDDVLYTISNNKIKLNDLDDLEELNVVELENSEGNSYQERYY
ncbi:MAG: beta-propeller domain-containing protein [Phycisphaerae bacterium]|nr:beta-propeller domain-containing protein [Phycisphaerae bacterium]